MTKTKVKMLTGIAGLPNPAYDLPEHSYAPGEVVMVHPTLASAWIDGGIAQAIRDKVPVVPAPDENEKPQVDSTLATTEQTEPEPQQAQAPPPKAAAKGRKTA